MAKKKRKTLPSDFYEMIHRGDIEELKITVRSQLMQVAAI